SWPEAAMRMFSPRSPSTAASALRFSSRSSTMRILALAPSGVPAEARGSTDACAFSASIARLLEVRRSILDFSIELVTAVQHPVALGQGHVFDVVLPAEAEESEREEAVVQEPEHSRL